VPGRADRLYRLDEPQSEQVERLAPQPPAEASSREALRQRLDDLPRWHPSAPRADRPDERKDRSDHDGDSPAEAFWEQVPRLEAQWESHVRRWPDKPASSHEAARKDDPPGSWRGRGDQYPGPEQNPEADRLIADLRRPEKEVTTLLKQIEHDNPHGGVLVGLEHRLKGTNRLKEKIADKSTADLALSLGDVASKINDAVRYTFCFGGDEYVGGCKDIRQRLESAGHKMMPSTNRWLDDPEYKGINTRWQTPEGGRFELQFHTRESFYAKEHLTHRSYDRIRKPGASWEERAELRAYQSAVSGAIPTPAGIEQIPYRWEGSG
jgi:hypothetical protein